MAAQPSLDERVQEKHFRKKTVDVRGSTNKKIRSAIEIIPMISIFGIEEAFYGIQNI